MKYAALMIDIVKSRHYQERYAVQNILMSSISYLNLIYEGAIKKELIPSAGDEFQGLFFDLQSAFLYVRKLQLLIYPIKIRCGIGYGEIKYDVTEWMSSAFDGEAYYLCRDAINFIYKRKNNALCFNTVSKYDKYLNEFCVSNMEIKAKQSSTARFIELIADIISPIRPTEEHEDFYRFIIESRYQLMELESLNKGLRSDRHIDFFHINFDVLFHSNQMMEIRNALDNKFYMEDFWRYGLSTYIAKIMNTTRQNIDRYVSLGKIKESRTMDKAIYDLLGEKIW